MNLSRLKRHRDVYDAMAFGVPSGYVRQRAPLIRPARFDVVVLAETDSAEMAGDVRDRLNRPDLMNPMVCSF